MFAFIFQIEYYHWINKNRNKYKQYVDNIQYIIRKHYYNEA